jgi:nitrogen fixation protein NifU and related proteins
MRAMNTPGLYKEAVLDHYRNPRNRGALDACTHRADGVNPLCGDSLRVELRCAGGRIVDMRFSGEACAVTIATASMLSELVEGLDAGQVAALHEPFVRILAGEIAEDRALGSLNAFGELRSYPARRKCAELPWATLCAALVGTARISTESP